MSNANKKQTSDRIASLAGETLQDAHSSAIARQLAASALTQANGARQTGAEMESIASKVLSSTKYADETRELAASVLSQANKAR